ncbi:MAG TPA: IS701 family transposase [Candidatus Methylomirabilis sp.]|nr:IS701 family transposase [Candidatus Methylomirabilis sp.]
MPSDEAWTLQLEDFIKAIVARGLTRPQRRHLWFAVLGLIAMLQRRTLTGLARQPGVERHESSVKRFMTDAPWEERQVHAQLRQAALEAIASQPAGAAIQLVIDDTATVKHGPHMEGIGRHYCSGQIRWGHCKVTLYVICGEVKVPWDFRIYVPKKPAQAQGLVFASKLALAQEMLAGFPTLPERKVCVLFDSFYTSRALMKYVCLEREWGLVARMESHRTARHRGRVLSGKELAAERSPRWWCPLEGEESLEGGGLKVTLWHGIRGQLVMTRHDGEGLEKVHYLVTNRRDLSASQVAKLYRQRWYIETYHRDAKQLLGLAHYQMRPLRGLRRHWTLVDLAYTALRLQACRASHLQTDASQPRVTLGSLRQQFRVAMEQERVRTTIETYLATGDYQQAYRIAGCLT